MTIEVAMVALLVSLIMSVLGGGVWLGKLSEKVRHNRYNIEDQKSNMETYRKENREEHQAIISRLDTIITNGNSRKKK